MVTIKTQIQKDFIVAMKEKNTVGKAALSSLKAKIIEFEKANGNRDISDTECVSVITTAIKQRKQSAEAFMSAGREEMANNEMAEASVLEKYMPAQLSENEVENIVKEILQSMPDVPNIQAKIGRTIGAFNKKYKGQSDIQLVKTIVTKLVSS